MPSQAGRFFLVTGGTSGMGYEDAKALAAAGAHVVIAARNGQSARTDSLLGRNADDDLFQDVASSGVRATSKRTPQTAGAPMLVPRRNASAGGSGHDAR